jgi:hypothetical protein
MTPAQHFRDIAEFMMSDEWKAKSLKERHALMGGFGQWAAEHPDEDTRPARQRMQSGEAGAYWAGYWPAQRRAVDPAWYCRDMADFMESDEWTGLPIQTRNSLVSRVGRFAAEHPAADPMLLFRGNREGAFETIWRLQSALYDVQRPLPGFNGPRRGRAWDEACRPELTRLLRELADLLDDSADLLDEANLLDLDALLGEPDPPPVDS